MTAEVKKVYGQVLSVANFLNVTFHTFKLTSKLKLTEGKRKQIKFSDLENTMSLLP